MKPIAAIAERLGLSSSEWSPYGHHKAKLELGRLAAAPRGKLVLVSAVTPTPAGEGKTTTSIGLGQALHRRGESAILALREPSVGPCFGVKGGGTGGGQSQLVPSDDINLHFNGDFHAISAAHNLLAAMVDGHLHFKSAPRMDARKVVWKRVMDMNDRSLREIVVGMGDGNGVVRSASFDITAASEVMAILCLSRDLADLRARLGRIIVGYDEDKNPVTPDQLGATGAMMALLKDALLPNLVQSVEGAPALVHGGPFANIAHGCNSVVATSMGLRLADWVVTEAGFAFDLGGEKFFDIKCASAGLAPSAVVLVATIRALKHHGGGDDSAALVRGLANLEKHVESVGCFGHRPVIALNHRLGDLDSDAAVLRSWASEAGLRFADSNPYGAGGEGCSELADAVMASAKDVPLKTLYQPSDSPLAKIEAIAKNMYGAEGVVLSRTAERKLADWTKRGFGHLPICMAKTSASLSDDPTLVGRPRGFTLNVRDVELSAGAGFFVALTGDIVRMPGLPAVPQAKHIDVIDGQITGLR